MDELLQADAANRQRALEMDSFIVEAPAGAGKTELLTQRYLRLLATVAEPEEIIAITFTNKAAGEMRQRIQESLDMARRGELPERAHKRLTYDLAQAALARSAERGWAIERQTGRLRLTTIDALCVSLARQMPLLSRFGSQPTTRKNARALYEEAAQRALAHLDQAGDAFADDVAQALAYLDNDVPRLVGLLATMLARREQWQPIVGLDHPESAIDEALESLLAQELTRVADTLDEVWQARLMPLARFAADTLGGNVLTDWTVPLRGGYAGLDDLAGWRAVADLYLKDDGMVRKAIDKRHGFPADKEAKPIKEAMLALLAELEDESLAHQGRRRLAALRRVRDLPSVAHAAANESAAMVRALARLMKLAAAELWLVFRERGEVDFGELAQRAIAALGDELDPSELGLRLDYRVSHLLVDEFQDTSPTQIELLQRLTAGWAPGDGRTLFVVGDPMQSIYRFRKADVGLFLRVAQSGIGGIRLEPLRLSRNNRSCPAVVAWINARFPLVFPDEDEARRGEIAYRSFVATRAPLPAAGVMLHPLPDGDDLDVREARQVMAVIEAEWREDPQRDIAVLVRERKHLKALVAEIRQRPTESAWHFSAVEIEPLAGRQVVQDLMALTRALLHRADRVNWLAVLRAPWCGLTLDDLFRLAGDDHVATVWSLMNDATRVEGLSADGKRRLMAVRAVLAEALSGQGCLGLRRSVEDVWRKLGGPLCLDATGGENASRDATAYFDRLDELEASGEFDPDRLDEAMADLYAAPDVAADGRLQLMTIHKSKGLEFDTVILPGLHRPAQDRDMPR